MVDRRIRFAVINDRAAKFLITRGDSAGAQGQALADVHDQIRIGADHRQIALAGRLQQRVILLDRVLVFENSCADDEVRGVDRVHHGQAVAGVHTGIADRAQAVTFVAQGGMERVGPLRQSQPGRLTGRHDVLIGFTGDAHAVEALY